MNSPGPPASYRTRAAEPVGLQHARAMSTPRRAPANVTFSVWRTALVLVALGLLMLGMIGRVAYLQTYGRERTIRSAERQQHQIEVLPSRRGSIFDRNGMLMSGTVQNMDLFVDP